MIEIIVFIIICCLFLMNILYFAKFLYQNFAYKVVCITREILIFTKKIENLSIKVR